MDTRRDAGEFYPGGKVISTRPVATGGDVKHSEFKDLDVKTNTLPDLRSAVKELAARLGATVVTALAVCAAIGAEVQTAKLNELNLDEDPSVVTNVTFEGLATTDDVARTVAPIARQVASNETAIASLRGDFVSASNSFSCAMAEGRDYVDMQLQNVYQQAIGYTEARLAELDVYGTAARAASNTVDDILLPRPLEWMYATGDGSTMTETAFAAPSFAVSPIHFTSDAEIGEEFAGTKAFIYPAGKLRNYSVLIESIPEDIPPGQRKIVMDFDELCASNKVYATPKLYAVDDFEHAWRITTNDVPCVITLREPEAGTVILRYDKLDGDDPGAYLKMEDGAPVIYTSRPQS